MVLRECEELRELDGTGSVVLLRPSMSSNTVDGRLEGAFCSLRGEEGVMMMSEGGGMRVLVLVLPV